MRMFVLKAPSTLFFSVIVAVAVMTSPLLAGEDTPATQKGSAQNVADDKAGNAQATKKDAAKQGEDERDYYTRRAQKMLKEDSAVDSKQHPLAENYPDQFVVVCEGGCKNHQAHIVDFQPRNPPTITEIGEMIPTAAGGQSAVSAAQSAQCIGGCTRQDEDDFDLSSAAGNWDSTGAAPTSQQGGESGRWLAQ